MKNAIRFVKYVYQEGEKDKFTKFIVALIAHLFSVANITEMKRNGGGEVSLDHQKIILTEFERIVLIQPFQGSFSFWFKFTYQTNILYFTEDQWQTEAVKTAADVCW